jgi:hypothetical protein
MPVIHWVLDVLVGLDAVGTTEVELEQWAVVFAQVVQVAPTAWVLDFPILVRVSRRSLVEALIVPMVDFVQVPVVPRV